MFARRIISLIAIALIALTTALAVSGMTSGKAVAYRGPLCMNPAYHTPCP